MINKLVNIWDCTVDAMGPMLCEFVVNPSTSVNFAVQHVLEKAASSNEAFTMLPSSSMKAHSPSCVVFYNQGTEVKIPPPFQTKSSTFLKIKNQLVKYYQAGRSSL